MTRLVTAVMALGLLAAATPSSAGCRWFGTQLQCDLRGNQVLIGTQAEDEPAYLRPFRPAGLHGGGALLPDRVAPDRPFRVDLQDVGADPRLCREIGNETYCY
jgi:hypothetical protein